MTSKQAVKASWENQPRDDLGRFSTGGKHGKALNSVNKTTKVHRKSPGPLSPIVASQIAEKQRKKQDLILWQTETTSEPVYVKAGPTGRAQKVVFGQNTYLIPVDENGNVPIEFIRQRYYATSIGNGRYRKTEIDSIKDAKVIIEPDEHGNFRPEDIIRWVARPNRYDIRGVDTADAPGYIWDYGDIKRDKPITIFNAYGNQEEMVREQISDHYNSAEIKGMTTNGPILIGIGKPGRGASGIFRPKDNAIYVDPLAVQRSPHTVVHETEHASRFNDPSRTGVISGTRIRANPRLSDQERTLEEASTEFGAIARLSITDIDPTSYHSEAMNGDPIATRLAIVHDKMLLGNGDINKDLRGKAATAAIEKNFQDSMIGELKLRTSPETAKEYAARLQQRNK